MTEDTVSKKLSLILPTPVGEQKDVIYTTSGRHTICLGAAGTGKTVMALWRAAFLSNPENPSHGKTLLVTLLNPLVFYLKTLCAEPVFEGRVEYRTFHKFAFGYLKSKGLPRDCIDGREQELLIKNIIEEVAAAKGLGVTPEFLVEELNWMSGCGIETESEYLTVKRAGRLIPLPPTSRRIIWQIRDLYRKRRSRPFDYSDIALEVLKTLQADSGPRMYKHIVIDEGQDFSPSMIKALVNAIPPDGSLTFFGDMAQQIFGKRMSWRQVGLNATPYYFKQNHRNTPQVVKFAMELTRMPYFTDETEDIIPPVIVRADGPLPVVLKVDSVEEEVSYVLNQARQSARSETVAILLRRRRDENFFKWPRDAIRLHRSMNTFSSKNGLYYGTYHAAKGMEFDTVMLPFFSKEEMPCPLETAAHGVFAAEANDGKLAYVAITRAKSTILVVHRGQLSELIPKSVFKDKIAARYVLKHE